MKRLRLLASIAFLPIATLPAVGGADPLAGRLLASQCAQCHGTDGNSISGIERLAGEDAQDILSELLDMKTSDDTGDIMIRQAKGYTDEQLRLIAEFFASLPRAGGDD